jgi:hypothetical protein
MQKTIEIQDFKKALTEMTPNDFSVSFFLEYQQKVRRSYSDQLQKSRSEPTQENGKIWVRR